MFQFLYLPETSPCTEERHIWRMFRNHNLEEPLGYSAQINSAGIKSTPRKHTITSVCFETRICLKGITTQIINRRVTGAPRHGSNTCPAERNTQYNLCMFARDQLSGADLALIWRSKFATRFTSAGNKSTPRKHVLPNVCFETLIWRASSQPDSFPPETSPRHGNTFYLTCVSKPQSGAASS